MNDWNMLRTELLALLDSEDLRTTGERGWTLATGSAPFDGGTPERSRLLAEQNRVPTFLPRWPVPPGLDDWLTRLLSRDAPFADVSAARSALAVLGPARHDPAMHALDPDVPLPDPLRSTDAPEEPDPLDGGRDPFT